MSKLSLPHPNKELPCRDPPPAAASLFSHHPAGSVKPLLHGQHHSCMFPCLFNLFCGLRQLTQPGQLFAVSGPRLLHDPGSQFTVAAANIIANRNGCQALPAFSAIHRLAKNQPVRWLFAAHDLECEKAGVISKRGVPSLAPGFYGAGSIPAGTQLWNQSLVFMPLCSRQQRGSSTLFSRRAFDSKKQRECAINPETAASRNHPGAAGFFHRSTAILPPVG